MSRLAANQAGLASKFPSLLMLQHFLSETPVLRLVPSGLKWSIYLLLLINIRSFPLAWHVRVWMPVFKVWFEEFLLRVRILFKSRKEKQRITAEWLESKMPIGTNPFEVAIPYRTWASIDDSDFNIHLSNSSYAKNLDRARFQAAMDAFPMFLRVGGILPLAGTNYSFIREIPMLANFEVRMSFGSWDEKWCYVVGKHVTLPKGKSKDKKKSSHSNANKLPTPPPDMNALFRPSALRTPGPDASSSPSPMPSATPLDLEGTNPTDLKAVASKLADTEEPDGATVHTISVSRICFKLGRITVPPALVFAMNGLSAPPTVDTTASEPPKPYSRTNLPPHWETARALMFPPNGGGVKPLLKLLKGGWKDVPVEERWWDQALAGVEQQRKERLEHLNRIRTGMEGLRQL